MANIRYDSQCEDLARYFLAYPTSEALVQELAGVIQQAIEDWDENRTKPREKKDATDDKH